jgi:RNA polymerase sigma factor (sigma-70 family)
MTDDDRRLVSRFLARRDEEAFRSLYRRHAGFLYRFLLRLTGGHSGDAEEGLQETWARAAASLDRFAWRSSLSTWLAGIAILWWREETRRRERDEPRLDEEVAAADRTAAVEALDLRRAVASLPLGYRETLLLHDVEGYTHEEIAAILGIESGTSKSQLSRARRALRARLAGGAR